MKIFIVEDNLWYGKLLAYYLEMNPDYDVKQEIEHLREEITQKYDFSKTIIGNSSFMQQLFRVLEKASQTNISVSIKGETGTGKEVVAKAIHYNSSHSKSPFVASCQEHSCLVNQSSTLTIHLCPLFFGPK